MAAFCWPSSSERVLDCLESMPARFNSAAREHPSGQCHRHRDQQRRQREMPEHSAHVEPGSQDATALRSACDQTRAGAAQVTRIDLCGIRNQAWR